MGAFVSKEGWLAKQAFYQFWNHVEMLEVLARWPTILGHSPEISNNNRTTFDLTLYFLPLVSFSGLNFQSRQRMQGKSQHVCTFFAAVSGFLGECANFFMPVDREEDVPTQDTPRSFCATPEDHGMPVWTDPNGPGSQYDDEGSHCVCVPSYIVHGLLRFAWCCLFVSNVVRPVDWKRPTVWHQRLFLSLSHPNPFCLFVCAQLSSCLVVAHLTSLYNLVYQIDIFASIPAVYSVVLCIYTQILYIFGFHTYIHIIYIIHIHCNTPQLCRG